ncbi:MAG: M15 family metallopeptidase, partial [Clostridiales bacterium]|nr:M15 family metallopeptidase [Clostridiales bacterium]
MRKKILMTICLLFFITALSALAEELPEDLIFPQETAGPNEHKQTNQKADLLSNEGILHLVNRDFKITKDYVPADLVVPKVPTRKKGMENKILLRLEAAAALEEMFDAAKREAKFTLYATSGYRSFGIQQILFNGRAQEIGRETANKTVALPGTSEHQLGLAMDVQAPSMLNLNRSFGDTDEGKWVAQNAHRFGFIIRYKREWTDITGYAYEPWHLRYLGLAHARALFKLNIPYEHYH